MQSNETQAPEEKTFLQKHRNLVIAVAAVSVLLVACCLGTLMIGRGAEEAVPDEIIDEPTEVVGELPDPTETPVPSDTPEPTDTPPPTDTPQPTATPEPTDTPAPTATSTPAPEPQVYSGTGDAIVDVEEHVGPAVLHITGNASARHFAVVNYGPGNVRMSLLVNTTDPYDGYQPLDWRADEETARFEVTATGQWEIEIIPLGHTKVQEHFLEVPGTYEGDGDDVIILRGQTPDLANISGNQEGRHFAVMGYADRVNLHVNTTDPYEGTVMLNPQTFALEVTARGSWSVEVTTSD